MQVMRYLEVHFGYLEMKIPLELEMDFCDPKK